MAERLANIAGYQLLYTTLIWLLTVGCLFLSYDAHLSIFLDYASSDGFKNLAYTKGPPNLSWMLSLQNASPDVCKVLVGNKVDAEDERVIDSSRGKSVRSNLFSMLQFLH